ncbi:MAG TPA: endonuclease/exonuclease/phosphatase family protein [Qipengyuania sp.]|nr:endonuclease/exonuclease/phosphatase family protein [Qipengyuania sp.]
MRAEQKTLYRLAGLALTLLLTACAHMGAAPRALQQDLRAMTFNIRLDIASDGANAWPHRKDNVAALIAREAPDILGMQEVLLNQKRDLEAALPAYQVIGAARDDGREAGEFSPLAWRRDRFEMVRSGTFWLSPTPEVPSKGWDAAFPRIATWAVLRDKQSGAQLRVLNTHFDHVGREARLNSAAIIARWVTEGPDRTLPAIVLGDFNAHPESEPYRRLAEGADADLHDARVAARTPPYGPPGTFTGFDITKAPALLIDHIFVTPVFAVESYAVITQHWGGRLPSDHYPVVADLRLTAR